MAKETAAARKSRIEADARKKKKLADEKAREKAKAAAEKKYQDQYLAFLDAVSKGEKRNFQQWKKHQWYKDDKAKKEAAREAEKKKRIALRKKEIP